MNLERNLINIISISSKFDLFRRLFKFGFLDSSNPKVIEMYNLCLLYDVILQKNEFSVDIVYSLNEYDHSFEMLMSDIGLKFLEKGD